MVEVVLPRCARRVGKGGLLPAGLAQLGTQPVDPDCGGVPDGRPHRPATLVRAHRQLGIRHPADHLDNPFVVLLPPVVERPHRHASNARGRHPAEAASRLQASQTLDRLVGQV